MKLKIVSNGLIPDETKVYFDDVEQKSIQSVAFHASANDLTAEVKFTALFDDIEIEIQDPEVPVIDEKPISKREYIFGGKGSPIYARIKAVINKASDNAFLEACKLTEKSACFKKR